MANIDDKKRLTICEIISIDPRIGEILAEAGHSKGRNRWRVYERYKARLSGLAGFESKNKNLCTSSIYETVIRALCGALKL